MKKILCVTAAIIIGYSNNSFSQQVVYEDEAITEISNWLPAGQYDFQVLEKDVPADLKEIIKKYQQSLTNNRVWFQSYKEQHPTATILPYHKNFGISAAEYERFNKEYPKLKTKVKTTKTLTLENNGDKITFKGSDGFNFFDGIGFDKKKSKMLVDTLVSKYKGQISEGDSSSFGAYSGYKWQYEKGNYEAVKALKSPDYITIELTISKTNNKMLMILKVLSIENLITKINSTVSGYIAPKQ